MSKTRVMQITAPDGQYQIPLKIIAEKRADRYYKRKSRYWDSTVNFTMTLNLWTGIDWIMNNSNWSDWKVIALKVSDEKCNDVNNFWKSGKTFSIYDVEDWIEWKSWDVTSTFS